MVASNSHNINSGKAHAFALLRSGRASEARALLADYCRGHAHDAEAFLALGVTDGMLGNFAAAENSLKTAVKLAPDQANMHYNLGKALQSQGKLEQARASYVHACKLQPGIADFHNNLGNVLKDLGLPREALQHILQATELEPASASYRYNLGLVLANLGQREQAVAAFQRALSQNPGLMDARCALGNALVSLGKLDEAMIAYDQVLEMQPANPVALSGKAGVLNIRGCFTEAGDLLAPVLKDGVDANIVVVFAQFSHHIGRVDDALRLVEGALQSDALTASTRAKLCFTLGYLHDRKCNYDKAFAYYAEGNRLRRKDFDIQQQRDCFTARIETFSPAFVRDAQRARNRSEVPVFILGMPRSGTTLVEQILANHPQVHGAGELDFLSGIDELIRLRLGESGNDVEAMQALLPSIADEFANIYLDRLVALAPTALRITDKMPGNFIYLGLIDLLFPHARIIHCRRNPLDTCLSCYFQDFSGDHPYANDLADLGEYYLEYARLMRHWRNVVRVPVLDVNYEDLSRNINAVAPKLIEFCGLDWDDACLDFHKKKRTVVTASYDQVRREIYTSSIERYRHYEKHITPLLEIIGDTEKADVSPNP